MKTILISIFSLITIGLFSQQEDQLFIKVIDELKIPIDTITATVLFTTGLEIVYETTDGKFDIDISPMDTAIIMFERNRDFYSGRDGRLKLPVQTINSQEDRIIVELTAAEAVNHGFYRLDLNKTFSADDILSLPDTISFYTYPSKFYYQKKTYVQMNSIDSNIYTFRLFDPLRKILVQESDYNKRLKVNLKENDSVTLTLGEKQKDYYVIGYKTYRGFEWRLIKEEK